MGTVPGGASVNGYGGDFGEKHLHSCAEGDRPSAVDKCVVHIEGPFHCVDAVFNFGVYGRIVVFRATKVFELFYNLEGVAIHLNFWKRSDLAGMEIFGLGCRFRLLWGRFVGSFVGDAVVVGVARAGGSVWEGGIPVAVGAGAA